MKKIHGIFSSILPLTLAGAAHAAGYELQRVSFAEVAGVRRIVATCQVRSGLVERRFDAENAFIETLPMPTDDAAISQLISSVEGVRAPVGDDAVERTEWWVRQDPSDAFKLIRAVGKSPDGTTIVMDDSIAAQTLAAHMGLTCLQDSSF